MGRQEHMIMEDIRRLRKVFNVNIGGKLPATGNWTEEQREAVEAEYEALREREEAEERAAAAQAKAEAIAVVNAVVESVAVTGVEKYLQGQR